MAPVAHGSRGAEQYDDSEGEDSVFEDSGAVRRRKHRPPEDTDTPVIKVWQLLLAIGGIMSLLLGAHYQFVMISVRALLQEHEMSTIKASTQESDAREAIRREIELLKQFDQASLTDRGQMRSDIERIERDLTLVKERQEQVRAKLGLTNGR